MCCAVHLESVLLGGQESNVCLHNKHIKRFAKFIFSLQLAAIFFFFFVHRVDQSLLMSQESSLCAPQDANYNKEDAYNRA